MKQELTPAPEMSPLAPEKLRWKCDEGSLDFATTAELEANEEIIGQDRALRAISLGLEMTSPGYNIFLAGFVGSGRNTTIRQVLQRLDGGASTPDDLCYVYGFGKPGNPVALYVPPGKGRRLEEGMAKMVRALRREVPQVLEGEPYEQRRDQILEQYRGRQRSIIAKFDERVQAAGFALVQVQLGPVPTPQVVPLVDGEPKFLNDLEDAADAGEFDGTRLPAIREKLAELTSELEGVVRETMKIDTEMTARLDEHEQQAVRPIVAGCFDTIREEFEDLAEVLVYLGRAEQHVLEHLERFSDPGQAAGANGDGAEPPATARRRADEIDLEYQVNIVVDNHDAKGAPVIVENAPSASRLFGIIERKWVPQGEEPVDHMKIRAGSLHSANGGYLVLNANDLFGEPPYVWHSLKRTLRTGRLELLPDTSLLGPPALKPEPVCISVKVVLIGDAHMYATLYAYDDDFKKIFKVRADFDTEMPNTPENLLQYGSFIQRLVEQEKILPFDRSGVARIAEHGCRLSGRQDRLSTRFYQIADLVREASYFASKDEAA
ncbi:MAG: AAA family ATPase, partial [Gemmatimonadetes bacterium]|nr:AAA family ATPase [Gemmatimonadota bacterium]